MTRTAATLMLLLALVALPLSAGAVRTVMVKTPAPKGSDQDVDRLLIDRKLKIVQITLRNGKAMDRHAVDDVATIQCLSGSGTLVEDDGRVTTLKPGVIVILAPKVMHVIKASPDLSILLTRTGTP